MKIINILGIVGVILAALLMLTSRFSIPGGYKIFSVLTGSMAPTISDGSLIIARTPQKDNEITKNEIIIFEQPGYQNKFVTHRVYDISSDGGVQSFITKGDSNKVPDVWTIPYGRVYGVYITHIPFLGQVLEYIKSIGVLVLLILLPTVVLILYELKEIISIFIAMKLEKTNKRFE